jgi:hypothetical protein
MLKQKSSKKDTKKSKGAGRLDWQAELLAQRVSSETLALLVDLRERYGLS